MAGWGFSPQPPTTSDTPESGAWPGQRPSQRNSGFSFQVPRDPHKQTTLVEHRKLNITVSGTAMCCVFHRPLVTKVFSPCRFLWHSPSSTRYTLQQGTESVSLPCPAHARTCSLTTSNDQIGTQGCATFAFNEPAAAPCTLCTVCLYILQKPPFPTPNSHGLNWIRITPCVIYWIAGIFS